MVLKIISKSIDSFKSMCVFLMCGGIYRVGIRVILNRISKRFIIQPKRHNNIDLISALIITIPIAPFSLTLWDTSANNALLQRKKIITRIACEGAFNA